MTEDYGLILITRALKVLKAPVPTNAEIARMYHMSQGYLCDLKSGKRDIYDMSVKRLIKLAKLYTKEME